MKKHRCLPIVLLPVLIIFSLQAFANYNGVKVKIINHAKDVCFLQQPITTTYNNIHFDLQKLNLIQPNEIAREGFIETKEDKHGSRKQHFDTVITYICGNRFITLKIYSDKEHLGYRTFAEVLERSPSINASFSFPFGLGSHRVEIDIHDSGASG